MEGKAEEAEVKRIRELAKKLQTKHFYYPDAENAANELAKSKHPEALFWLVDALKNEWSLIHWLAGGALVKVGPRAIPELHKLIDHPKHEIRHNVVRTLSEMKHPDAIPPLMEALEDSSEFVREQAIKGLLALGKKEKIHSPTDKRWKALQLVAPYFSQKEELYIVQNAYRAALEGKVTEKNARLYIKQLRAMKGSVK